MVVKNVATIQCLTYPIPNLVLLQLHPGLYNSLYKTVYTGVSIADLYNPLIWILIPIRSNLIKVNVCAETHIFGKGVLCYIAIRAKGKCVVAGYELETLHQHTYLAHIN